MFSRTAAEDSRIVVHLDFTLVVPAGQSYAADPEQTGLDRVFLCTDEKKTLTIGAPVPSGVSSFTDPMSRGTAVNFMCDLLGKYYRREVSMQVLVDQPYLLVVAASVPDKGRNLHFAIAAGSGIYSGTLNLPSQYFDARSGIRELKMYTNTMGRYTPTHEEELAAQAAARKVVESSSQAQEKTKEPEKTKAPEETPEPKKKEELKKKPLPREAVPDKGNEETSQQKPAPKTENRKPEKPAEERKPVQTAAPSPSREKEQEEAAPALTPEELRIRELEQERRKKIQDLRRKYAGNSEVESQIDNYIARCERTADQVTQEFRNYLVSVQNYAVGTRFAGTDDPKYLEMLSNIQQAENSLGGQLDTLVRSADENASNAADAGITEAFVERLIRFMDHLDRKYATLSVDTGGDSVLNRVAYRRPAEIDGIFKKWRNRRYALPSYIEQSEEEIEKRVSEEIQTRVENARDAVPRREEELAAKRKELETFQAGASRKRIACDNELQKIEEEKDALELAKQDKYSAQGEKIRDLKAQMEAREDEADEIEEDIRRTFSLQTRKKKELTEKLDEANGDIAKMRDDLTALEDEKQEIGAQENAKLAELDARTEEIVKEKERLEETLTALEKDVADLEKEIETDRKIIQDGEEEWKHVHENYLLGKYDVSE